MSTTTIVSSGLVNDGVVGARGIVLAVEQNGTLSPASPGFKAWRRAIRDASLADHSPLAPLFAQADDRLAEAQDAAKRTHPEEYELLLHWDVAPALRALIGAADALSATQEDDQ